MMSAAIFRSKPSVSDAQEATLPAYIRAQGRLSLRVEKGIFKSKIADLYEAGGYRLKFPRGDGLEATIVNTGGGMAGGDHLYFDLGMGESTSLIVSTQSANANPRPVKLYQAQSSSVSRVMKPIAMSTTSGPW